MSFWRWCFFAFKTALNEEISLDDYAHHIHRVSERPLAFPEWAKSWVDKYENFRKLQGRHTDKSHIYRLVTFLSQKNIDRFELITPQLLIDFYLQDEHSTPGGKHSSTLEVRRFLIFLAENNKLEEVRTVVAPDIFNATETVIETSNALLPYLDKKDWYNSSNNLKKCISEEKSNENNINAINRISNKSFFETIKLKNNNINSKDNEEEKNNDMINSDKKLIISNGGVILNSIKAYKINNNINKSEIEKLETNKCNDKKQLGMSENKNEKKNGNNIIINILSRPFFCCLKS